MPGCCNGTPDELFMDMANGEMDVSCVLSNGDVSSLFFIIAKKGVWQFLCAMYERVLFSRGHRGQ